MDVCRNSKQLWTPSPPSSSLHNLLHLSSSSPPRPSLPLRWMLVRGVSSSSSPRGVDSWALSLWSCFVISEIHQPVSGCWTEVLVLFIEFVWNPESSSLFSARVDSMTEDVLDLLVLVSVDQNLKSITSSTSFSCGSDTWNCHRPLHQ